MPELKIGIAVSSFRQPLKKALHTAASLGARGVQIDARRDIRPEEMSQTGARHFRKLLEDLNLKTSAVAFQTRRGYAVLEDLDRRIEATKAAMRFARRIGAAVVVNQIGRVPQDESSREWETLVAVLTDLGVHAQTCGAFLAAKTGTESGADLARLVRAVPEGSIGVDLDPGLLVVGGFSPSAAVKELGPHVMHVTASDAIPDLALGRGTEVPLGRGTADLPELLGRLEEFDYRGWFTIDRRGSEDPTREVGDAVKFLASL